MTSDTETVGLRPHTYGGRNDSRTPQPKFEKPQNILSKPPAASRSGAAVLFPGPKALGREVDCPVPQALPRQPRPTAPRAGPTKARGCCRSGRHRPVSDRGTGGRPGPVRTRRDPPGSARTRQDPPGPAGCVVVGRSPPQPREDGPGARSATACRRRPPGAPASLTAEPRARSARCPVWTFRSSPDGRVRQRREGGSPGRAALLRPLRRGGTRTALSAAGLWREPLRDRARRFLKSVWKSTPARSRGGPSPRPRPTASRVVD